MTDPPKKRRPMQEGDAVASMAKFVAGLPAQRDPVAETREQLAYLIRAELVCCDIYNKINAPLDTLKEDDPYSLYQEKRSERNVLERLARKDRSYHDICYFGEWAAQLCLHGELPAFPLVYTGSAEDDGKWAADSRWIEELVQPGPVRIKTVRPNAERPKRMKEMFDA